MSRILAIYKAPVLFKVMKKKKTIIACNSKRDISILGYWYDKFFNTVTGRTGNAISATTNWFE